VRAEAGGDDGGWMRRLGFREDEEAVDRPALDGLSVVTRWRRRPPPAWLM
jgi:hypothetical protein